MDKRIRKWDWENDTLRRMREMRKLARGDNFDERLDTGLWLNLGIAIAGLAVLVAGSAVVVACLRLWP